MFESISYVDFNCLSQSPKSIFEKEESFDII